MDIYTDDLIGEGGRGLGFGLAVECKDAREKLKNLIPNPESLSQSDLKSDSDSDSEFDDLIKKELDSEEFNCDDLIGYPDPQTAERLTHLAKTYSEPQKTPTPKPSPYADKYAEALDRKAIGKYRNSFKTLHDIGDPLTAPHIPKTELPDGTTAPIGGADTAALRLIREATRKRLKKVAKLRPKAKPLKPEPKYNPYDGGIIEVPEAITPDTRSPEPLKALLNGQKLMGQAEEGFPTGSGRETLPVMKGLDPRERAFVGNLFNGMTADEAAERAGYPVRPDLAMVLIAKPHIKTAIEWMQQEYLRSIGATLTRAVTQMAHIAFLDPRKVVDADTGKPIPLHELDTATAAALEGVEITETDFNGVSKITKTKYKFNSKLKALQQLGEHLGLFNQVQKVELTGANGGPVQMEMSHTEIARRIAFVLQGQSQEITDVDSTIA